MVSRGPANDSHVICAGLAALGLDDMFTRHALGHPSSPHPLLAYEQDTPFAAFPGERTLSCSANAHALQVLSARPARTGTTGANRYLPGHRDALAGGLRFLADVVTFGDDEDPICHGQELYAPPRLVDMLALIKLEAAQLSQVS
jgi:hypothetical protein